MPNVTVTYFEQKGPANTDTVLRLAKKRANELGIETVVVASTKGNTGVKAARAFQGKKIIVVSHCAGFETPDIQQLTEENRKRIQELGAVILTATHPLAGVNRAVRLKFNTVLIEDIMAETLRLMGQGTKVACEISAMAADAGLVRTDQDVIAIAGSNEGADTALVIKPANTHNFFDIRVREIICKPREPRD